MKAARLGTLEQQVMDILWEKKECFVKEVLLELEKNRKFLAYTTVATILQRLHGKELIGRKEKRGGYQYFPKLSKERYGRNVMKSFLRGFMDSFGDIAIASFAKSIDTLPKVKRRYFLKLLHEYDKS